MRESRKSLRANLNPAKLASLRVLQLLLLMGAVCFFMSPRSWSHFRLSPESAISSINSLPSQYVEAAGKRHVTAPELDTLDVPPCHCLKAPTLKPILTFIAPTDTHSIVLIAPFNPLSSPRGPPARLA